LSSAQVRPWLLWAARFGYAACGFIYIAIGVVAAAVALGLGEEPTGSHGVMRFLSRQPFAPLLLATLGIGLAGYAALNITGAITDPERRGVSVGAIVFRSIDILTGALYIGLTFAALGFLVGSWDSADTAVALAEKLMGIPFGSTILGLTGVSLVVGSAYLFIRAAREEFGEMLDRRAMSKKARAAIVLAARAGTAARGVIFAVCGVFAIRSAIARSPQRIGDVDDALAAIGEGTLGPLLLAIMGAGFVAYGVYQLSKARYQRVVDDTGEFRSGRNS
jgi:uncharacterized protein DUF1206